MTIERYAFDAIDRLQRCGTRDAVVIELRAAMACFGFDAFIATGIPRAGQSMQPLVLSVHWPEAWMDRYMAQGYDQCDPTVQRVRSTLTPFRWSTVAAGPMDPHQKRVMDEATDYGLVDGLVVPIHDFNGLEAGISFGTSQYVADDRSEAALYLLSIYAYEALRRPAPPNNRQHKPLLSRREVECVQWVAAGKTAWETSEIMGLAESSVKKYVDSAARKMNVTSRPHLVARCMRAGLIS